MQVCMCLCRPRQTYVSVNVCVHWVVVYSMYKCGGVGNSVSVQVGACMCVLLGHLIGLLLAWSFERVFPPPEGHCSCGKRGFQD